MRSRGLATAALVLVTVVWGSTFFLIKGAVASFDPIDFLAIRFVIAAALMVVLFHRHLRGLPRRAWRDGLLLGVVYGLAQVAQTWGLRVTDASISGFVTGTYVIITPILMWAVWRRPVARGLWVAVALAFGGLAVLSLTGFSADVGALITLVSAVIYAVHIVLLEQPSRRIYPFALATVQMIGIAITCAVLALPGGVELPSDAGIWMAILYTSVVAGILTLVLQTWAQRHLSPTRTAVIMTLEPVFASLFAVALGTDSVTVRLLIGGGLILAAMVVGVATDRGSGVVEALEADHLAPEPSPPPEHRARHPDPAERT